MFKIDLAHAWKKLDINGDETIKTSEVSQFLNDLNINMSETQIEELIKKLDK